MSLGATLRNLRVSAGLSQTDLACDGVSASYISLIESGKRTPSPDVIRLLAEKLGCHPSQLIGVADDPGQQVVELELKFAELALTHGDPLTAAKRSRDTLERTVLSVRQRDEARFLLARALGMLDRFSEAIEELGDLLDRCHARSSHLSTMDVAQFAAGTHLQAGEASIAARILESALKDAATRGQSTTLAYSRLAATLMWAHMASGEFTLARIVGNRTLDSLQSADPAAQGPIYWNLSSLAEHEGRLTEAMALVERALSLMSESENSRNLARLHLQLASLALSNRPADLQLAGHSLEASFALLSDLGGKSELATWHAIRSQFFLIQGNPDRAIECARIAGQLTEIGDREVRFEARLALSDALRSFFQDSASIDALREAQATLNELPTNRDSSAAWRSLGERFADLGEESAALEAFRKALDGAGVPDRSYSIRQQVAALRARPPVTVDLPL